MKTLVELLTEAAGTGPVDDLDAQLAASAEAWLLDHGWEDHYRLGFSNGKVAFDSVQAEVPGEPGLLVVRRAALGYWDLRNAQAPEFVGGRYWEAVGTNYRVHGFGQALTQLTLIPGILNERFSPQGRDALHAHAEVCDQMALVYDAKALTATVNGHNEEIIGEWHGKAEACRMLAEQARQMYPLRIPA